MTPLVLFLGTPVSGQTKKPTPKAGQSPKPVPNAKSKDDLPTIPGLPPNMPAAMRDGIIKQLQQQVDERTGRRKQAAKEAVAWINRVATEKDAETRIACLVIAGAKQVDALRLTEALKTFARAVESADGANPMAGVPDAPNDGPTPSPWSIEARLFLFDLALEHELNVTRAEEWLQPAVDWLKTVPPPGTALKKTVISLTVSPSAPNAPLPLQSLGPKLSSEAVSLPGVREVRLIAADVRLRLGLLAALHGELARAVGEFQQADALGFEAHSSVGVYANRRLTGQRLSPLPDPVHNGPDNSESLIRLALLFGESREFDRALRLWDALLAQKDAEISLPQRSFAHLQRALVRSELTNLLERNQKQIAADYTAVAKLYPDADCLHEGRLQGPEQSIRVHGE